jgi:hypothetical protein
MSKNYLRLNLGEQERGLKFNMGTLKIIKELVGSDPLEFFKHRAQLEDELEQLAVIVYAAAASNMRVKKEIPDFTLDDARLWVDDMDLRDVQNLTTFIQSAYEVEASGEEATDTRA